MQFHRKNITVVEVVQFLRLLLQQVRGSIVLLWDGGTIHRRQLVLEYLNKNRRRLRIHRFLLRYSSTS